MINGLITSFGIFTYTSICILVFFLVTFLLVKKFNNRWRGFYSFFLDISKREALLYATVLLNFLLLIYFLFNIDSFNYLGVYMIVLVNIISSIFSFNFYLIFVNILYCFISVELLRFLNAIDVYLVDIFFDKNILLLKRTLIFMIAVYAIFITIRKFEIILRKHGKRLGG